MKNQRKQRTALIIAAGFSSRVKAFKPLLPLGGLTIIEQTLASFVPLCERLIVVGGYSFDVLENHLKESAFLKRLNAELVIVRNKDYGKGMFSSVRCGAETLADEPFLFCPGDIPGVMKETVRKLAAAEGDVVVPRCDGKSGHPVKLSARVREAILKAPEEDTLRSVLTRFEKRFVEVDDPAIHWDVDYPEDFQRMVLYFNNRQDKGAEE